MNFIPSAFYILKLSSIPILHHFTICLIDTVGTIPTSRDHPINMVLRVIPNLQLTHHNCINRETQFLSFMLSIHVGHGCNHLPAINRYPPAAYLAFVILTSTVNNKSGLDEKHGNLDT